MQLSNFLRQNMYFSSDALCPDSFLILSWKIVQCWISSPTGSSPVKSSSSSSHHDGEEVCGRILPPCFLPSQWPPVDTQAHKHLSLLVPPLGWGVGVIAVLFNTFLQCAVNAKLFLEEQGTLLGYIHICVFGYWLNPFYTDSTISIFEVHTLAKDVKIPPLSVTK